jgi:hypothetical protein
MKEKGYKQERKKSSYLYLQKIGFYTLKTPLKTLIDLINTFSNIAQYKINIQR